MEGNFVIFPNFSGFSISGVFVGLVKAKQGRTTPPGTAWLNFIRVSKMQVGGRQQGEAQWVLQTSAASWGLGNLPLGFFSLHNCDQSGHTIFFRNHYILNSKAIFYVTVTVIFGK